MKIDLEHNNEIIFTIVSFYLYSVAYGVVDVYFSMGGFQRFGPAIFRTVIFGLQRFLHLCQVQLCNCSMQETLGAILM